jgi:hypothetical protein
MMGLAPSVQARAAVALSLALVAGESLADGPGRLPAESAAAFAARHLPSPKAELLRTDELAAWVPGGVVAFYAQPVPYQTPSPQDRDVIGILYLAPSHGQVRSIVIDTYGPQGANAEVVAVGTRSRPGQGEPVLVVRVVWRNNHGELEQVCSYLRPSPSGPHDRLVRLKSKSCRYID